MSSLSPIQGMPTYHVHMAYSESRQLRPSHELKVGVKMAGGDSLNRWKGTNQIAQRTREYNEETLTLVHAYLNLAH
jgi:hypothetical protein